MPQPVYILLLILTVVHSQPGQPGQADTSQSHDHDDPKPKNDIEMNWVIAIVVIIVGLTLGVVFCTYCCCWTGGWCPNCCLGLKKNQATDQAERAALIAKPVKPTIENKPEVPKLPVTNKNNPEVPKLPVTNDINPDADNIEAKKLGQLLE